MQIAEYDGGRRKIVAHVGSAHTEAELGILIERAREVLADQYGLTLPEAGRACAEATRAIISHLAQATPGHGTHRQ